MDVQFVSDAEGKITAVQVPLKQWKEVKKKLEAFEIAEGIKKGYKEMQQIENGKVKAKLIEQFLDEL